MRVVTRSACTSCAGSQCLSHFSNGPGLAALGELVLQLLHPLTQESVVVVQLGHRPHRARVREAPIVTGGLVGGHRNLVAANVIGVRVAAVLVVGGHHVRPEFAHHPDQRLGGHLQRRQREAVLRQRRRRIPLRQAGIDEAEPGVFDAEDFGGLGHLVAADVGDAPVYFRQVHRRVEDVAALAPGQGDHQHAVSLVRVTGKGGSALAGLVVRVGVHRHQPQFAHVLPDCVLSVRAYSSRSNSSILDAGSSETPGVDPNTP